MATDAQQQEQAKALLEQARAVCEAVQQGNGSITQVDLARHGLDDDFAEQLAFGIAKHAQISRLDLRGNAFGPKAAEHLSVALQQNWVVKTLLLENNILGPQGAVQIAHLLEVNDTLEVLSLGNQFLGASGARAIAASLRANKRLSVLFIEGTSIGVEGAEHFAKALERNDTLTKIDLAGNGMGHVGVGHLAAALEGNRSLKEISLRGNRLEDTGAEYIASLLRKNGVLEKVDLSFNNLSDTVLLTLAEASMSRPNEAPSKIITKGNASSAGPSVSTTTSKRGSQNGGTRRGSRGSQSSSGIMPEASLASFATAPSDELTLQGPTSPLSVESGGGSATVPAALASAPTPIAPITVAAEKEKKSASISKRGASPAPVHVKQYRKEEGPLTSPAQLDDLLETIETALKLVDVNQGSHVRLTKAEIDLLGLLEVMRDSVRHILSLKDRSVLRVSFGGDCRRVATLRACLNSVRLSEANASDQRYADCNNTCSALEELLCKEGLADRLKMATSERKGSLLQTRASLLLEPAKFAEFKAQMQTQGTDLEERIEEDDDDDDDEDDDEDDGDANDKDTTPKDEQTALARRIFDELDKNADGKVTKTDMKAVVQAPTEATNHLRLNTFKDVQLWFMAADTDHKEVLDFPKFLAHFKATTQASESSVGPSASMKAAQSVDDATLKSIFQAIDTDHDNKINLKDLRIAYASVLLNAGVQVIQKRVGRWAKKNLRKFASNGAEHLNYREFQELMSRSDALAPAMEDTSSFAHGVTMVADVSSAINTGPSSAGNAGNRASSKNSKRRQRSRSQGQAKARAGPRASRAI